MVKKKIFIYEEEAIVALDIKTILSQSGKYQPVILRKNENFSAVFNSEKPELIIASVNARLTFPEEILLPVKEAHIPMVILAHSKPKSITAQLKLTLNGDILLKPFDKDELIFCVQHLIEEGADQSSLSK
ncbi:MAG: hypothetical protein R6W90_18745 [Ignavibacteriaceae bacterium]